MKWARDKEAQLKKYAKFAQENPDVIERVEVVCSRKFVAEVYLNIKEILPENLRKYISVEWVE